MNQLPYVIAIARHGSLSAASRALGVSQPALSAYLNDLEKETGLPLFFRSKKRLCPTPAGQRYLQAAQEILAIQDQTRSSIASLGHSAQKELRIGITPHRGAAMIASIYLEFMRSCPEVRLVPQEGYAATLLPRILQGELDLGILGGGDMPGLSRCPVWTEELFLMTPSFHPISEALRRAEPFPRVDLSEFRDSVFILAPEGSSSYLNSKPLFQAAGFQPRVSFTTPNMQLMVHMIAEGIGVGLVPAHYAGKDGRTCLLRLRKPGYMVGSFYMREGMPFGRTERFLLYLILKYHINSDEFGRFGRILWTDVSRSVLREFDEDLSIALHLDPAKGTIRKLSDGKAETKGRGEE